VTSQDTLFKPFSSLLVSRWGYVQLVQFLLDHGADATAQTNYESTPLRPAFQGGHVKVVHLLLKCSADTTSVDEQVATPFRGMLHQGDLELARMLERDADATA
jgi:ankyrin repeat protein